MNVCLVGQSAVVLMAVNWASLNGWPVDFLNGILVQYSIEFSAFYEKKSFCQSSDILGTSPFGTDCISHCCCFLFVLIEGFLQTLLFCEVSCQK